MHKHIISRHLFQLLNEYTNGPFISPVWPPGSFPFFDHRIVPSVFSEQTFFSIKTVVKTWVKIQDNNITILQKQTKNPKALSFQKLYPSIPFLKITAGII